uniref:Membrane protein n=2 Tax=unclassified Caudoviricetes TaxID=2788787 RepID=A0AAU8EIG5_9CAUD|nr:putative membrane protein [Bacillus phage phiBTP1]
MIRTANLLTIFFLSLWTYFCLAAFYQTEFGVLSISNEFKDVGRFAGMMGAAQLVVLVVNLLELWKEKYQ